MSLGLHRLGIDLNYSRASDASVGYHNFLPRTRQNKNTQIILYRVYRTGITGLTELLFFGPIGMAGDAFSVSDELVSLFGSTPSLSDNTKEAACFSRFGRNLASVASSSPGILENRCV